MRKIFVVMLAIHFRKPATHMHFELPEEDKKWSEYHPHSTCFELERVEKAVSKWNAEEERFGEHYNEEERTYYRLRYYYESVEFVPPKKGRHRCTKKCMEK